VPTSKRRGEGRGIEKEGDGKGEGRKEKGGEGGKGKDALLPRALLPAPPFCPQADMPGFAHDQQ